MNIRVQIKSLVFAVIIVLVGCDVDQPVPNPNSGYPSEIGVIMESKCSIEGCHDAVSKGAAAGLNLETWETMFEGSKNNAAVIPYRPDQSFMMFFINTFPELGPVIEPTMPYGSDSLPISQVKLIQDWINMGAPNKDGVVKFADSHGEKIYLLNQGCDLVAIMDAESKLIMRYVDVGSGPEIESPHHIHMSHDQEYWYVCFYAGGVFQKFSANNDQMVGEVNIGLGSWNTFAMSEDGSKAFVVDLNASGSVAVVDLENMELLLTYQGAGLLEWPHGSAMLGENTLYVTAQYGNFIYKIDVSDVYNPNFEKIVLAPGETPSGASSYDPHEIHFTPDGSEYVVTCQESDELRFFNTANDSLIAVVPTGRFPQELAFSEDGYVFVTCMEDDLTFPGLRGSVTVINYLTRSFVKHIYTGYQPHGIAVSDDEGVAYVLNRNASLDGPAPHHTTDCGGRNGYMTLIDLSSLELLRFKAELSVDPYHIALSGHHH